MICNAFFICQSPLNDSVECLFEGSSKAPLYSLRSKRSTTLHIFIITAANERPWQLNWNWKRVSERNSVLEYRHLWAIIFHTRLGHASFTFFSRVHKVYYPPWECEVMGILSSLRSSLRKALDKFNGFSYFSANEMLPANLLNSLAVVFIH